MNFRAKNASKSAPKLLTKCVRLLPPRVGSRDDGFQNSTHVPAARRGTLRWVREGWSAICTHTLCNHGAREGWEEDLSARVPTTEVPKRRDGLVSQAFVCRFRKFRLNVPATSGSLLSTRARVSCRSAAPGAASQTSLSPQTRRFLRQARGSADAHALLACRALPGASPAAPLATARLSLSSSLTRTWGVIVFCCSVQNLRLLSKAEKAGLLSLGAVPTPPRYTPRALTYSVYYSGYAPGS